MISKKEARKNFQGSNRLFESCWRKLNQLGQENFDSPMEVLEQIASEKVNDSKNSFYIYGK